MEGRVVFRRLDDTAAGEEDDTCALPSLLRGGPLPGPEAGLAFTLEDLRDGTAGGGFDHLVQIHGLPAGEAGERLPHRGLATAGHTDQDEIGHLPPELNQNPLILTGGNGPVEEPLLCRHRLGHQHGQSVRAGDAPRLRLQQQGRAPGIVDDVQHPLTDGKYGQVHGRLAVAGVHAHRSGVHQDLRVSVAREVVIVVRTETGYHHDLGRAPLPGGGLGRQRRPAAAQNHDFFP